MAPTISAPFQCRFRKRAVRLDSWAVFLGRFCRGLRCFPRPGRSCPPPGMPPHIAFAASVFCHRREMGLDASWGFLRHGFPIVEIRIGLDRRLLRLCRILPGFQLAFRPPVLNTAVAVAHSLLKTAFPQVARLDAGIFLLHLPDLAVDRCACLLNGAGQRIGMLGGMAVWTEQQPLPHPAGPPPCPTCGWPLAAPVWPGPALGKLQSREMDGPLPPRPPDKPCAGFRRCFFSDFRSWCNSTRSTAFPAAPAVSLDTEWSCSGARSEG